MGPESPAAITVLLPFRDAREHIYESLESLRAQTLEDFEVLMVDDGSSDGSRAIAESFRSRDSRFRLLDSPGHGLVDALNAGLAAACGEWIARHDADDVCHPDRLEAQAAMARSMPPRSVVSCMVESFRKGGVRKGYRLYEQWLNSLVDHEQIVRGIFIESPVPHPTAFYRREEVMAAGGYSDGDYPEDYELWLRLWAGGFTFRRVPAVLLYWRDHPRRLSRTDPRYSVTSFYRIKASYLRKVPCLAGGSVTVWGSGQAGRRLSGFLLREGFVVEAFVTIVPERVGRTLRGVTIVSPDSLRPGSCAPVLVASRAWGAREEIRCFLENRGFREWKDYVLCA
ncbi:glycosyltransferase [Candidatus Fermentibacterales bacterium]|nr:glycosyltransferase [Candidatus Fermentibacterales bacterium]